MLNSVITKGRAFIYDGVGLRCKAKDLRVQRNAEGKKEAVETVCNQLICRHNSDNVLAGSFKCPKCGQLIEVNLSSLPD